MFTSKRRTVILLLLSCLLNFSLSLFVYIFRLPMWLDTVGTIYISMAMGSSYGFCVGLVNNVVFSTFLYGYNSMLYYIVSFFVALISGMYARKKDMITTYLDRRKGFIKTIRYIGQWILLGIFVFIVSGSVASIFTIALDGGVPSDYSGRALYEFLVERNFYPPIATFFSVMAIKFIDVVVTLVIVAIAIKFTPTKYITDKFCADLYVKREK